MDAHQKSEEESNGGLAKFLFRLATLYTEYKYSRPIKLKLTRVELVTAIEALDVWIEGYRGTANEEEELIEGLHDSMSRAIEVRARFWSEL